MNEEKSNPASPSKPSSRTKHSYTRKLSEGTLARLAEAEVGAGKKFTSTYVNHIYQAWNAIKNNEHERALELAKTAHGLTFYYANKLIATLLEIICYIKAKDFQRAHLKYQEIVKDIEREKLNRTIQHLENFQEKFINIINCREQISTLSAKIKAAQKIQSTDAISRRQLNRAKTTYEDELDELQNKLSRSPEELGIIFGNLIESLYPSQNYEQYTISPKISLKTNTEAAPAPDHKKSTPGERITLTKTVQQLLTKQLPPHPKRPAALVNTPPKPKEIPKPEDTAHREQITALPIKKDLPQTTREQAHSNTLACITGRHMLWCGLPSGRPSEADIADEQTYSPGSCFIS